MKNEIKEMLKTAKRVIIDSPAEDLEKIAKDDKGVDVTALMLIDLDNLLRSNNITDEQRITVGAALQWLQCKNEELKLLRSTCIAFELPKMIDSALKN